MECTGIVIAEMEQDRRLLEERESKARRALAETEGLLQRTQDKESKRSERIKTLAAKTLEARCKIQVRVGLVGLGGGRLLPGEEQHDRCITICRKQTGVARHLCTISGFTCCVRCVWLGSTRSGSGQELATAAGPGCSDGTIQVVES